MQPMQMKNPLPDFKVLLSDETDETDETEQKTKKYFFGDVEIDVDHKNKNIYTVDGKFSDSPKIYEIVTNKNTNIEWKDLDEQEKDELGRLLTNSKFLYNKNYNEKKL